MNSILEKYENFEEIKINKLKIEEISDTFYAIMKTLKSLQENKQKSPSENLNTKDFFYEEDNNVQQKEDLYNKYKTKFDDELEYE